MNDRRKKGCPNEHCIQHINKVKNNAEIDYCPKCGSKGFGKTYHPAGISFKGKGFYSTDNRSK